MRKKPYRLYAVTSIAIAILLIFVLGVSIEAQNSNQEKTLYIKELEEPVRKIKDVFPEAEPVSEIKELEKDDNIEEGIDDLIEQQDEAFLTEEEYEEEAENVENDNIPSDATFLGSCTITYYCAEKYHHICNGGSPYLTANGTEVMPYSTCAVDPFVIPLGSTVYLEDANGNITEWVAQDTGGAVNSYHIDCAVGTHQEALNLGKNSMKVYFVSN